MAIDANSYFSNQASVGLGGATAGQFNKFDLHATPKYNLGFKVEAADGSVYRYSHFGAATVRGVLVSQDISETSVVDTDNVVIAPASAVSVSGETLKPGALGSTYVQITLASVTANQYRGGKFVTTDDTGEGYTYDIIGNTATDNPATGDFRLSLAQPLQVALDTTTDISIMGSPYSDLEASTGTDEYPAGVSCASATAALPYGWIQTKGTVGLLQQGSVTQGDVLVVSNTAGAAEVMSIFTQPIVGFCADPGDSTGHMIAHVDLE